MSPEPVTEPVGFEPVGFPSEPVGFNYNGVDSATDSSNQGEETATECQTEAETDDRQVNVESDTKVPLLGNGSSYDTYTYPEAAPVYPPPSYNPPTVPAEAQVYAKRPLEEETEEATPESKRVRENPFPAPETPADLSLPAATEEVPTPPPVTECPAPNGVNSAPPQPIHAGGD